MTARVFAMLVLLAVGYSAASVQEEYGCIVDSADERCSSAGQGQGPTGQAMLQTKNKAHENITLAKEEEIEEEDAEEVAEEEDEGGTASGARTNSTLPDSSCDAPEDRNKCVIKLWATFCNGGQPNDPEHCSPGRNVKAYIKSSRNEQWLGLWKSNGLFTVPGGSEQRLFCRNNLPRTVWQASTPHRCSEDSLAQADRYWGDYWTYDDLTISIKSFTTDAGYLTDVKAVLQCRTPSWIDYKYDCNGIGSSLYHESGNKLEEVIDKCISKEQEHVFGQDCKRRVHLILNKCPRCRAWRDWHDEPKPTPHMDLRHY